MRTWYWACGALRAATVVALSRMLAKVMLRLMLALILSLLNRRPMVSMWRGLFWTDMKIGWIVELLAGSARSASHVLCQSAATRKVLSS